MASQRSPGRHETAVLLLLVCAAAAAAAERNSEELSEMLFDDGERSARQCVTVRAATAAAGEMRPIWPFWRHIGMGAKPT